MSCTFRRTWPATEVVGGVVFESQTFDSPFHLLLYDRWHIIYSLIYYSSFHLYLVIYSNHSIPNKFVEISRIYFLCIIITTHCFHCSTCSIWGFFNCIPHVLSFFWEGMTLYEYYYLFVAALPTLPLCKNWVWC